MGDCRPGKDEASAKTRTIGRPSQDETGIEVMGAGKSSAKWPTAQEPFVDDGLYSIEGGQCGHKVPMSEFPALPKRDSKYWTEPLIITTLVGGLCTILVILTTSGVSQIEEKKTQIGILIVIYTLAGIAALCVLLLLFARHPDEVRRSAKTCYPMPEKVARQLIEQPGKHVSGLGNVAGPEGSSTLGSYCVRCLVWRPPTATSDSAHHCSICQRCVIGFDHHCGVIGRCITRRNMPVFITLIAMLPAGVLTAVLSVVLASAQDNSRLR